MSLAVHRQKPRALKPGRKKRAPDRPFLPWTLPRELVDQVRARSEADGVPASHIVEDALRSYLAER